MKSTGKQTRVHAFFCLCVLVVLGGCPQGDGISDVVDVSVEPDVLQESDVVSDIVDTEESDLSSPEFLGPKAGPMNLSGTFRWLELPGEDEAFPVFPGSAEEFPAIMAGTFGDLDEDGIPEVIIGNLECCDPEKRTRIFKFDPETESLVPADDVVVVNENTELGLYSVVLDLDQDGLTDVVSSGFHSIHEKGVLEPSHETPIFYGEEGGTFAPSDAILSVENVDQNIKFSGTLDLVDLDSDGWLDILLSESNCTEGGASMYPLIRVGIKEYQWRGSIFESTPQIRAETLLARPFGPSPMTVFIGGHNCSDGDPMDGFFMYGEMDSDHYPVFSSFDATPLMSVYKESAFVSYGPITKASPMGSVLTDFNHDGLIDLNVSLFCYYAMFQGTDSWPLIDRTEETGQLPHPGIGGQNPMIPWGVAPIDVDLDGFTDLVVAHGDDDTSYFNEESHVGLQYTTTYRNMGGFVFEDITDEIGLSAWGHWRSMTVGDLNRDGKMDLIIGGVGHLPRVYLNVLETPHYGFAVALRGSTSNAFGIGAKVAVTTSATPPQVHLMGNSSSPIVVSEPLVFFGTGTAATIDTLQVTWPSGYVQELKDLPSEGHHVVHEPPLIVLDPVSRHVQADGVSTATIRVRPHDVAGLPMEATVEIDVVSGNGSFEGSVKLLEDGSWERKLVSPQEPGSSVIAVKIDGIALQVRPRIWWD